MESGMGADEISNRKEETIKKKWIYWLEIEQDGNLSKDQSLKSEKEASLLVL